MAEKYGESCAEKDINEPSKQRKDHIATTKKSVVVLRTKDVRILNDRVFMPNTIEMAQLKKPHMGRFKTNMQFSSSMTETDVKDMLIENFPVLRGRRFYCASVVDQRTRLDFHGKPCVWDGKFVKKRIKGNSALYIFIEEDNEMGDSEFDSECECLKEPTGMKRSFDQITTNGESTESDSGYESLREPARMKRSFDQLTTSGELLGRISPVKMSLSSMNSPAQSSSEKPPGVLSTHDSPSVNNSNDPTSFLGQADKGGEESEVELLNERPPINLQQTGVTPSILLLHNTMGGVPIILLPNAGGIPVTPVLSVGNNALNTVSAQQSVEVPLLPDSDNPGLQSVPQASTLAPQVESLDVSIASSQQSQNTATTESSIERSLEALTTVDTTEISQQVPLTGARPESNRTDLVGDQQETENFKSADQERQSDVGKTDSFQVAEKEPEDATAVTGDQESSGPLTLPTPNVEPLSSDTLGSGFETSQTSKGGSSQNLAKVKAAVKEGVYFRNVMLLKKNELVSGEGKVYMPTTIEMARMRRRETGQYQKSVQFSKDMSEEMVRRKIQETFPFLDKSGSFSCASISNQDSTLQFHGFPRVWDGRTLRRILKGNSALYIVMEESQTKIRGTRKPECAPERSSQSKDTHLDEDLTVPSLPQGFLTDSVEEDSLGSSLSVLCDVATKIREAVERKSITMIPNRSSMKGGVEFVLIFNEALPLDLSVAYASFEHIGTVELKKLNPHNLIGNVPASSTPGRVTVRVTSSSNHYLGETCFEYWDEAGDTLRQLVKDPDMQRLFSKLWTQNIDSLPPQTPPYDIVSPVGEPVNESVFEEIDEATPTDSSDDENPGRESGDDWEDEATSSDDGNQASENGYDGEDEAASSDDGNQVGEPVNESVFEEIDEATPTDSSDDENPVNERGYDGEDEASSSNDENQGRRGVCAVASKEERSETFVSREKLLDTTGIWEDLENAMAYHGYETTVELTPSCDLLNMIAMHTALLGNNIKIEDPMAPSNIPTPCQVFGISTEDSDSAPEENCSNSDNDVDQPGVVQDICPLSGSVKGGIQFHIMLTEELLDSDKAGVAQFDGVGDVLLEKTNPYTFSGFIPSRRRENEQKCNDTRRSGPEILPDDPQQNTQSIESLNSDQNRLPDKTGRRGETSRNGASDLSSPQQERTDSLDGSIT